MSRLSRSGSLRASSSVSPPASSPLRPASLSKSTSPSSPSPLSGIFSPHKRKAPPLTTAAEYEGIEEEDEDVSSGDSADDTDLHQHSFAAEYALANGHNSTFLHPEQAAAVPSSLHAASTQAAVRASALTAALSAVRNVSPSSALSTPSPNAASSDKQLRLLARPVSPATSSPLGSLPAVSASAPLPATVLKGNHATTVSMELDESEEESEVYRRARSSPIPTASSPPPSASLDWPPTPSSSQLSDTSLLASLRLSSAQRQRLSSQLSQHIDLTLSLRRLLAGSRHSSSADSESASTMHRKATELLSSLCAVRVAHLRMYSQHSVLDVAQLDGLQQRLHATPFEEAMPAGTWGGGSGVVAVQPTVASAVLPKGTERGVTRATMAGVVTATAVGGSPQYAANGWSGGGAAMASVMPGQPVMATLGTATPAAAYSAAARLLSHSSAPAATAQPVTARLVQPAQRSVGSAVLASTAASASTRTVAASPAAGSLTSALSSLSSSLASFANSPQHTRSPTPLMANLSLYPAQHSPATPVTATVMAAQPPTASSFSFSPTVDPTLKASLSPSTAVAVSPPSSSPASALSASLARSSISPTSNSSPSPGHRSIAIVPAVAISPDGAAVSPDVHAASVSSSFSAQSELSSLDSFASLALASFSPSTATSPLAENALNTLASLAHTDNSLSDSSPSISSSPQSGHTTAPVSASSRSSSYRSSDQPNKRSRSQSQHEPDSVTASSSALGSSQTLRKNRSQQGLSKLDTPRTSSPMPASTSQPRLSSSASFTSLSSMASSPSPSSPLPASGSFPAAVPASVISNHSPRRRTYSPRATARRVVAASVVLPASVANTPPTAGGGNSMADGSGLLSPSSMQVVAALWSGHEKSENN